MTDEERLDRIEALIKGMNDTLVAHIASEDALRPQLVELVDLLTQSKGVLRFLRVLIFMIAPIVAVVVWIKDHVRL